MAVLPRCGLALKANDKGIEDIYLDATGNLAMVYDAEAVGQHAAQRLMAYRGEWFLDKDVGVPWMRDLLGKGYDPILAEAVIKAEIMGTDGVTAIRSFSVRFNRARRELENYSISVNTEYEQEVQL